MPSEIDRPWLDELLDGGAPARENFLGIPDFRRGMGTHYSFGDERRLVEELAASGASTFYDAVVFHIHEQHCFALDLKELYVQNRMDSRARGYRFLALFDRISGTCVKATAGESAPPPETWARFSTSAAASGDRSPFALLGLTPPSAWMRR